MRSLSTHAKFDGPARDVHLRTATLGGKIYVDIADSESQVIEVDRNGWRILRKATVWFRRTTGMAALPLPQRGGSIEQLRRFVNLDATGFILFVAVLAELIAPRLAASRCVLRRGGGRGQDDAYEDHETIGPIASTLPAGALVNSARSLCAGKQRADVGVR